MSACCNTTTDGVPDGGGSSPTPPPGGGLSSPLLFGRNGRLGGNVFLRLAGNVAGGPLTAYAVNPGTQIVSVLFNVAIPSLFPIPVSVVVNGSIAQTITLPALQNSFSQSVNITVPDSGSGVGLVALRTGIAPRPFALNATAAVYAEEP